VPADGVARVAPDDEGRGVEAFADDAVQPVAAVAVDGGDVAQAVLADGAVAEQQFDRVGGGDADALELFGVGGELQQGGDAGAARELGVLHQVAAVGLAHDEVGEPEEGDLGRQRSGRPGSWKVAWNTTSRRDL
jgi:hypothetical protein